MAIRFQCHECGLRMRTEHTNLGRRTRCKHCRRAIVIAATASPRLTVPQALPARPGPNDATRPATQAWIVGLGATALLCVLGALIAAGAAISHLMAQPEPTPRVPPVARAATVSPTPKPTPALAPVPTIPAIPAVDPAAAEREHWMKAQSENTVAGYEGYLSAFPKGRHADEAQTQINRLEREEVACVDHRAWDDAKRQNTVDAFAAYLRDRPRGAHAAEAVRAIEECRWQAALRLDTIAAYEEYLRAHPAGNHAADATQAKARVHEDEAWRAAAAKDVPNAYARYLEQYPDGPHVAAAQARLAALRAAAAAAQDDRDWGAAVNVDTRKAYREYLAKHPGGRHVAEAQQNLEQRRADWGVLAAACRGKGVAEAAPLQGRGTHRCVCLDNTGAVHPWNEQLPSDWRANSVEETELVVVIYPQQTTFLSRHHYQDGSGRPAPSISRFRNDVLIQVIAARTGRKVDWSTFFSVPRMPGATEPYSLTTLSDPVDFEGAGIARWLGRVVTAPPLR